MCRPSAVLALALLLTSQVALAQRVAVSAIEGDAKGKLRAQVTAALRKSRKLQVLPPTAWAQAAGKQGLTGAASVKPQAMALLAPKLQVDAVLTGEVKGTFRARLVGRDGQEVWSGSFPLKRGALAPKEAAKLAQAVAVAVKLPPPQPAPVAPPPPETPPAPEPVVQTPPAEKPAPEPVVQTPPAEKPAPEPVVRTPPAEKPAPDPVARTTPPVPEPRVSEAAATTRWVELDAESHTYTTPPEGSAGGFPEEKTPEAEKGAPGPARVRVVLGAAVTWRRYCARPGVGSCSEFDAKPEAERTGDLADFTSNAPYVGLAAQAELFPLAHLGSPLRGLGLTLALQRGFARTTVVVSSPSGPTPEREVYATDTAYGAMLAYRYFFARGGTHSPLWGHAGLRLGVMGREFDVDEAVESPLPVVHRLYPAVGLDVSVPLMRAVRIQGSGEFFLRPTPGQTLLGVGNGTHVAEVRDYGTAVSSFGWSAELGLAGEVWGPIGYSAKFRLEHYADTFSGVGARRGWTAGGVAEDTFSGILAGVTLAW